MGAAASAISTLAWMVAGSVTAPVRELAEAASSIAVPIALSRRISFIQCRGGSGASILAAAVASTIGTRRIGSVLAVNAAAGWRSLPWYARVDAGFIPSARRRVAGSTADAVDGLPVTGAGLHVLDLVSASDSAAPARASRWYEEVAPIARFFDVVCTDWGVREAAIDLPEIASASHAICLVTRADRHAVEDASAVVEALPRGPGAPPVVLAVVDCGATGATIGPWLARETGAQVVPIPFDAARASEAASSSRALEPRSRTAVVRLTAALVTASIGVRAGRLDSRRVPS